MLYCHTSLASPTHISRFLNCLLQNIYLIKHWIFRIRAMYIFQISWVMICYSMKNFIQVRYYFLKPFYEFFCRYWNWFFFCIVLFVFFFRIRNFCCVTTFFDYLKGTSQMWLEMNYENFPFHWKLKLFVFVPCKKVTKICQSMNEKGLNTCNEFMNKFIKVFCLLVEGWLRSDMYWIIIKLAASNHIRLAFIFPLDFQLFFCQ